MSLFQEMKRRNVFRVAFAYVITAWLLIQVADVMLGNIEAPAWVFQVIMLVLGLGFPISLIFAWAFELTPEGIKKEKEVDRTQSITHHTGRKLDYTIISVLAVALAWFAWDKFTGPAPEPQLATDTEIQAADDVRDKSIAVLPFTDMSEAQDQEYFSDGISEEILNALARVRELKVAGRTSSFAFKGRNDDLRVIGSALGVAHILEGSIRKSGDRLRITAQLIKVDDGFHLWSDTYDREMTDVFAIQDEIAGAILEQMKLHLIGPGSATRYAAARGDVEAFNLYLAAKQNIYTRNRESLELAVKLLDRALAIDPAYAPAQAQRAIATILLSDDDYGTIPEEEALAQAKVFIDEALRLDPNLAEAFAVQGLYFSDTGQYELSIESLQKALTINPNLINASNWLQESLNQTGDVAAAGAILESIVEQDPLYRPAINNLALQYARMGNTDKLTALAERTRLYLPGDEYTLRVEHLNARSLGKYAEAYQLVPRLVELNPGLADQYQFFDGIMLLILADWEPLLERGAPYHKVFALRRLGRYEEARQMFNEDLDPQENPGALIGLLIELERYKELTDWIESQWPDLDEMILETGQRNPFDAGDLVDLAWAYQKQNERARYDRYLSRAEELDQEQIRQGVQSGFFYRHLAYTAVVSGDPGKALDHLLEADARHWSQAVRMSSTKPAFAALDGEPRYEALLRKWVAHINSERARIELGPIELEPYL